MQHRRVSQRHTQDRFMATWRRGRRPALIRQQDIWDPIATMTFKHVGRASSAQMGTRERHLVDRDWLQIGFCSRCFGLGDPLHVL